MTEPTREQIDAIHAAVHQGWVGQVTIFCDSCGVENTGDYIGETSTDRFETARKHLTDTKGWDTSNGQDSCPNCKPTTPTGPPFPSMPALDEAPAEAAGDTYHERWARSRPLLARYAHVALPELFITNDEGDVNLTPETVERIENLHRRFTEAVREGRDADVNYPRLPFGFDPQPGAMAQVWRTAYPANSGQPFRITMPPTDKPPFDFFRFGTPTEPVSPDEATSEGTEEL